MFVLNRTIQLTIVVTYSVIVIVNGLEEPKHLLGIAGIFGMLALIPIGITQLFTSIIDFATKKENSPLKRHLLLTLIVFGVYLIGGLVMNASKFGNYMVGTAFIASIGLMLYYWYVIFIGYKKPKVSAPKLPGKTHGMKSFQ